MNRFLVATLIIMSSVHGRKKVKRLNTTFCVLVNENGNGWCVLFSALVAF